MLIQRRWLGVGSGTMIILAAALLLAACDENPKSVVYQGRLQPQTAQEVSFATSVLADLQIRSIAENLEYCGFIGIGANGALIASPALQGDECGCRPQEPEDGFDILASYHTHAAYAADYDSEVPSLDDLRADVLEGIDGYIATPGERIWYNSAEQKQSILLCGENCIISDPGYQPDPEFPVSNTYNLESLKSRQ